MNFYGGAMKNILKKFLLIFVIGVLSQPCIENTCWGAECKDNTALNEILYTISKIDAQKNFNDNIDIYKKIDKAFELSKQQRFIEFISSLEGDKLFNLVTTKRKNESASAIFEIPNDKDEKIKNALKFICNQTTGKLLIVRLLVAVNKTKKLTGNYTLTIKNGKECRADNERSITLDLETLQELRYTLFSDCKQDNSILMTSNLDEKLENVDVALFHEMVHVFHGINSLKNVGSEISKKLVYYKNGCTNSGISNVVKHPLFKYYFENFIGTRQKIDDHVNLGAQMMPWHVLTTEKVYRVNFEEMLTIAGLPIDAEGYEPGDELSENLYRAEKGLPLRFGHRMFTYYESSKVHEKVKKCVVINLKKIGVIQSSGQYKENPSKAETEKYGQKNELTKQEGLDGMYYYTINPSFNNSQVKEKFKYHLNVLVSANEESIDYYLRSEYNEWVFNRFRFD